MERNSLNIGLDYDETYTADPELWETFIGMCKLRGHDVRIVTYRHETLDTVKLPVSVPIIYTNGVAKRHYAEHFEDFTVDIWIDDSPERMGQNSSATKEWLNEWRATRDPNT